MYRISVITVVLNGAETIEKTIRSVLEQDYPDIEYIIIDGGSEDGTIDIIKKYEKRIACFVSEPDNGIYYAMNKGIERATGDIIGIINSDDWYEPGCFKTVAADFEEHDNDIVYGDLNRIGENGIEKRELRELKYLCLGMVLPHPTVFVKKSVYGKIGLFDTSYKIAADYDFLLRCYMAGVRFGYIPETLADFTLGGISVKHLEYARKEESQIVSRHINDVILDQCFSELIDKKVTIHGAGFWGTLLIDKLTKLHTKDIIWVDKNCDHKGERSECGIELEPLSSGDYDRQIIVAIYHGEEIEESYLKDNRICLTVKAILDEYMNRIYEIHGK